jgi:hypothetical protein
MQLFAFSGLKAVESVEVLLLLWQADISIVVQNEKCGNG